MNRLERTSSAWQLVIGLVVGAAAPVHGQQFTWTGGGGNNDFSNPGNWSGGVPTDPVSAAIVFDLDVGGVYMVENVIVALTDINGIRFDGATGSYLISGSGPGSFQLASGNAVLNNSSSLQRILVTLKGTNGAGMDPGTLTLHAQMGDLEVADVDVSAGMGVEFRVNSDSGRTVTINGVISGGMDAGLVKNGAGTLILNNANTYGGLTTITEGRVVVGNDTAFSNSLVQVTGDAQLEALGTRTIGNIVAIQMSDTLTITGMDDLSLANVTGMGTLRMDMDGSVTLLGNNSTGAMELNRGTVVFAHDNAIGGTFTVTGNASIDSNDVARSVADGIIINSGRSMTFAGSNALELIGPISGGGGLVKEGTATLTLGGTNTYTGQTMINEGILRLENGDALDDGAIVFIANAAGAELELGASETIRALTGGGDMGGIVDLDSHTLTLDESFVSFFGGTITGATGGVVFSGTGTVGFDGANTYAGGTVLSGAGGEFLMGDDMALGSGPLTIDADLTISPRLGERTIANPITVNSDFNIGGIDAITFTGDVTLPSTAEFAVVNSTGVEFSGMISGAGGLTKAGGGAMTLSGTNTYTGDTTVDAGTLLLSGSVAGDVVNNATLDLDMAGSIGGDVTNAGTFLLRGSVTGNVDTSAALSGGGTVMGTLTNLAGGTISPGEMVGTLTVGGNYLQQIGSTLAIELNAADGSTDLLSVAGTATLASGSTLAATIASSEFIQAGQTFTVIAAGAGVTDNGVDVTTNSATMTFVLQRDSGFMNGDPLFILEAVRPPGTYEDSAVGSNNQAVGGALDSLVPVANSDPNGAAADLLGRLDPLDDARYNQALTEMSPEPVNAVTTTEAEALSVFAGTQAEYLASKRVGANAVAMEAARHTGMLASAVMNPALLGQAIEEQEEAYQGAYASNPLGGYMRGFGVFTNQDPSENRSGFDADTYGGQAGIDYTFSERFLAGVAFAYVDSDVDLDGGAGDFDIDSWRVGPYYTEASDGWHLDVSLTVGFSDYESRRNINTLGLTALGDYDGWDISGYVGVGYEWELSNAWTLTPAVTLLYSHFEYDGYQETGAAGANLSVPDRDTDSLRSRLGVALTHRLDSGSSPFFLDVHVGWEHEYLDNDDIESTFSAGGNAFNVDTGDREDDSFVIGSGLTKIVADRLSVFFRYEGLFSSNSDVHAVTGGLTFKF